MFVVDLIITLFQGIFIGYALNKCLGKKNNKKLFYVVVLSILINSDCITNCCGIYKKYYPIIGNAIAMIFIGLAYKRHIKESLTIYSICMIILNTYFIFTSNLVLATVDVIYHINIMKAIIFVV